MCEDIIRNDSTCYIGANIRRLRKEKGIRQVDMVRKVQLLGVNLTRETLVKIERGIQHIKISQLRDIKEVLGVTYDDLLE